MIMRIASKDAPRRSGFCVARGRVGGEPLAAPTHRFMTFIPPATASLMAAHNRPARRLP
jgi:hypothetical protein